MTNFLTTYFTLNYNGFNFTLISIIAHSSLTGNGGQEGAQVTVSGHFAPWSFRLNQKSLRLQIIY